MRVHASAPTRVDLAGGTLDIWPLYPFPRRRADPERRHHGASRVPAGAQSRRGACAIVAEDTGSQSGGGALVGAHRRSCVTPGGTRAPLLSRRGAHRLHPLGRPPVGAGLAGSSALNIALCAALARWQDRQLAGESLIALALNLEAQVLGVPTGGQDYRPATYGGIAALEMGPAGVVSRVPLGVDPESLTNRMVLVYTEQSRDSGINNWEVTKRRIDGRPVGHLPVRRDPRRRPGDAARPRSGPVGRGGPATSRSNGSCASAWRRGSRPPDSMRSSPAAGRPAPTPPRSAAPAGGGCLLFLGPARTHRRGTGRPGSGGRTRAGLSHRHRRAPDFGFASHRWRRFDGQRGHRPDIRADRGPAALRDHSATKLK